MVVRMTPSCSFVNKSARNDSFASEFYYNRSILQTTINPYELISSTLHNNEFSPSSSMNNLMRRNEISASELRKTIVLPNRQDACRLKYSDFLMPNIRNNNIGIAKTKTIFKQPPPPPPPALESLPLSVKSISNKIIRNSERGMYSSEFI